MQVVRTPPTGTRTVWDPDEADRYYEKDRCEFCLECGDALTQEEWDEERTKCYRCADETNNGEALKFDLQ